MKAEPLKIAFLAWDANALHENMVKLAVANSSQLKSTDLHRERMTLMDGTVIRGVHPQTYLEGLYFDQVIVANDRRLRVLKFRGAVLNELDMRCQHSLVPEDYRFQFFDLDEEVPANGEV